MANAPEPVEIRTPTCQFLQLLIQEIEKGYIRKSTLTAESWEYICHQMNIEFAYGQRLLNVPALQMRLLRLQKMYNDFSALLALDGVQWDMKTNKVKAEMSVWRAYYKAHPNAPPYWDSGEKYFDLMCQVFESGVHFI